MLILAGTNDVLRAGSLTVATALVHPAATTLGQILNQVVQNGATLQIVAKLQNIDVTPKGPGPPWRRCLGASLARWRRALQANGLKAR